MHVHVLREIEFFVCIIESVPNASNIFSLLSYQKLDIRDNPDLTMPPKPVQQVKGSGAEWYNIDFDPDILKRGAVVSSAQIIKGQWVCLN